MNSNRLRIYLAFSFFIFVTGCASTTPSLNIDELRKSAAEGDPVAQLELGYAYDQGIGVKKDTKEAVKWYTKSAKSGNPDAQNNLGSSYQAGEGVAQNSAQAVKWYTKAANQGHPAAQNSLAIRYLTGQGVKQNSMKAIYWYEEAAKNGNIYAFWNLADIYIEGQGVEKNYVEAYKWLDLARFYTQRSKDMNLKWGVRGDLDALKAKMTQSQISEGNRLATEWDKKQKLNRKK